MLTPILTTKLFIPATHSDFVIRDGLIKKLNQGQKNKSALTLISAAAGFGKTALAAYWLGKPDKNVAWVSLGGGDNDPNRFLLYLVTALNRVEPHVGKTSLSFLKSPDPPPCESILAYLINDLAALEKEYILALDDYHMIAAREIHDAMIFFLENLPPQLHLVIISRTEPPLPIATLRSKNKLLMLSARDLRFSTSETEIFFNQVLNFGLSDDQISQINTRTEGWVTGMQLMATTLKNKPDTTELSYEITGNNKYISDYLVAEVVSCQPEKIRQFLLQTSFLGRMCSDLCNKVCGIGDSQAILETLEKSNLFLVCLDDTRKWYRYHPFLSELLCTHMIKDYPDLCRIIYKRAADWHVSMGLPEEAVKYALNGKLFYLAADIIEKIGYETFWQNRVYTLKQWLDTIPDEIHRSRPQLRILYAYATIEQGEAVEKLLQGIESDLRKNTLSKQNEKCAFEGKLRTIQAAVTYHRYMDGEKVGTLAENALEKLPRNALYDRSIAHFHWGGALILTGDIDQARRHLQKALILSGKDMPQKLRFIPLCHLGRVETVAGALHKAHSHFKGAINILKKNSLSKRAIYSNALTGFASLEYEWNNLEKAGEYIEASADIPEESGFLDVWISVYASMIRLKCALGDFDGAASNLARVRRKINRYNPPKRPLHLLDVLQTHIMLARNEKKSICHMENLLTSPPFSDLNYENEFSLMTLARVLIVRNKCEQAVGLLSKLHSHAKKQGRFHSIVKIDTLLAKACHMKGEKQDAVNHLHEALCIAEPEGYIRSFADRGEIIHQILLQMNTRNEKGVLFNGSTVSENYIKNVITGFDGNIPRSPSPGTVFDSNNVPVQLTPREIDVLRLIGSGMSDVEIAKHLVVAESTVRTHLRRLYSKLYVNNRIKAVVKAKDLGLIQIGPILAYPFLALL